MKRSTRQNLAAFGRALSISRFTSLVRSFLWEQEWGHTLWMPTPNLYIERDLGYQTVVGQRVKCRRVTDTAGLSLFVVADSFRLPCL